MAGFRHKSHQAKADTDDGQTKTGIRVRIWQELAEDRANSVVRTASCMCLGIAERRRLMRNSLKFGLLVLIVCVVFAPFVRAQISEALCTENAHRLVNAVLSYAQDHDEILPPMDTDSAIETALFPYTHSRSVFLCPITHQFYQFNRALSRVSLAAIRPNFGTTELLRDARPHPDGKITIAYMDGYVTYGGVDLTPEKDCGIFARNLAIAASEYAQDYDETMPAMQNAAVFAQVVQPYVGDSRMFVCPVTGLPYTPNAALSGVSLSTITDWGTTEVVQDAQPHPDGKVTIAYLDGIVIQGGIDPNADPDCVTFVQKLMNGIDAYAQDHASTLPPMQNNAALQSALMPYILDSRIFVCPATGLPYALNSSLSGINPATLPDTGTVILVQDAQPHPDNRSTVGYLDGHILQGGVVQPNTETACDDSLGELAWAAYSYAIDHNNVLPPMKTFRQFWDAIYPYIKSSWKFHCPATHTYYVPNAKLSGAMIPPTSDWFNWIVIRDAKPHPDKTMGFGYLNGTVVRR
jgi:hypothetical protein